MPLVNINAIKRAIASSGHTVDIYTMDEEVQADGSLARGMKDLVTGVRAFVQPRSKSMSIIQSRQTTTITHVVYMSGRLPTNADRITFNGGTLAVVASRDFGSQDALTAVDCEEVQGV